MWLKFEYFPHIAAAWPNQGQTRCIIRDRINCIIIIIQGHDIDWLDGWSGVVTDVTSAIGRTQKRPSVFHFKVDKQYAKSSEIMS